MQWRTKYTQKYLYCKNCVYSISRVGSRKKIVKKKVSSLQLLGEVIYNSQKETYKYLRKKNKKKLALMPKVIMYKNQEYNL